MNTHRKQQPDVPRPLTYVWVPAVMVALLGVSVGSAFLDLGALNVAINLAVAVTQALLVMIVLMHGRGTAALIRLASALGFVWLGIMIALTLTDFLARVPVPPPW